MGIDFHHKENRDAYTSRRADETWLEAVKELVPVGTINKALDVGCGGGIYSKALAELGINSITGIDFSETMLEGARKNCKEYGQITFRQGSAFQTGEENNVYDLLLERALIHHIKDLNTCFDEAHRVLKEDGIFIVQDRTPDDCILKGDGRHIRGYFFDLFPKLVEKETNRRHKSDTVIKALKEAGFTDIKVMKLWETRQIYKSKKELLKDLRQRTGRSILFELEDEELRLLINHIDKSIPLNRTVVEQDRWTIWRGVK
ncbi:class I SAM-dependent methyltransferase [Evansella sp. LMS18]|jgi:ubiquinone/menaquinone biosynthesis C-methylase UbiE|uniref:class I SAM-dependent methyltransferase n=1 Tax=Evansella sp. LMS18 TaxID=2924033 RepID=UPI0020D1608F|nr:class I SAM-dependent methyltransferase [Evansella sp. LMS18]UTR10751.1 class I SAM-dependent methyltransferase [Evansella sp. LMS18]